MTDGFGKRGLSWHITHVVQLRKSSSHSISPKNCTYEHRSFIHVFNNCTQNSRTVVSILSDALKKLKKEDPQIQKAFVRSDNTGCYKGNLDKYLLIFLLLLHMLCTIVFSIVFRSRNATICT